MFKAIGNIRLGLAGRRVVPDSAWDDPELPGAEARVRSGDLEAGRRLLAESRSNHELRGLRANRLAVAAISKVTELARLSEANPGDPDLALWLGTTRIKHGWEVRTGARAKHVSSEQFNEFWFILGGTHEPLMRAADLLADDPVPWDQLQWRALGLELGRAELDEAWAQLEKRDSALYIGHYSRMQALCEKWQGSNEEVLDFVTATAAAAAPGDPLAALVVAAHLEVAAEKDLHLAPYFTSVHEQVAAVADKWMANVRPHLRTAEAHHLFGAAFYLADDHDRARRHLERVSATSIPRNLPWGYLSDTPGGLYVAVRHLLGLR